jgi:uncharacterized protein
VKEVDAAKINELAKDRFEIIETHISWVLLGDFVYKIKKPVKFSFLDFSTLERRRFLCEEEVRLNKRLAPEIYLGVVPVTEGGIGNVGEPIDYAIKMMRLPQEKRMDLLLDKGKVTGEHVREIAAVVAGFHGKIDTITDKKYSSAEVVKKQIDDLKEFRETIDGACGLGKTVDFILEESDAFIAKNRELFSKRQDGGKIKDCHGDLHSANIFISEKIVIFDCIEFSRDFRFVDTASEVAFMAMDLDAFGREDLSQFFVDTYVKLSSDTGLPELLQIYKCYRANVRAKIAAIDYSQNKSDEAKERIRKYVLLAENYAKGLSA